MAYYKVAYYRTARGDEPVLDFVGNQDLATRSKVNRFKGQLEKYGPDLGMPYARYLKQGLYELRIRGKDEVRIFYMCVADSTVVLLHAFKKRTPKLPEKELKIARERQKKIDGGITHTL